MSANFFFSRATCYAIARDVIHEKTNFPLSKMRRNDVLRDKYRMEDEDVKELNRLINDRVVPWGGAPVSRAEAGRCTTLATVAMLIASKLR